MFDLWVSTRGKLGHHNDEADDEGDGDKRRQRTGRRP